MWETLHNNAGLDCFRTLTLPEILRTQSQHQEEFYAFSEAKRSCQQVGCARNRLQFHTVPQKLKLFLSMHVCAWMGFPLSIFGTWCLKYFTLHQTKTNKTKDVREPQRNLSANIQPNMRKQIPTKHTNLDMANIDHVPSNGIQSGSNAMLCVFEDNKAVIKMIIKGRSPTMRHVSRTHRVALDWLSDRINLDSKIQIRHIDTKHQLADILTKGTSHMMSGKIFFICLTSAISALLQ